MGGKRKAVLKGASHPVWVQGRSLNDGYLDAFARQRFSQPHTIFESKQIWDDPDLTNNVENYPLFWDNVELSGGGTSTEYSVNRASTKLHVSTAAGHRVRQTKRYFNYQTGKSQLFVGTLANLKTVSGITKRIGIMNGDNGLFFQSKDGVISVGIRSNVTGTPVDTIIEQSNWNIDRLDNTLGNNNSSGIKLLPETALIPFIDYEWLGVGRVRYGFFINGVPTIVHEQKHANIVDSVYMSTPNLPIRYEIINDGTGPADYIECICCTVISEGGVEPTGAWRTPDPATVAITEIQANTPGKTYAVAGMRLKDNYKSAQVNLKSVNALARTNDNFIWSIHLNPTLDASLTYSNLSDSVVEYAYGNTTNPATELTAPGVVIDSGFVSNRNRVGLKDIENSILLGSFIDGTRDEYILAITPITANINAVGSFVWNELW